MAIFHILRAVALGGGILLGISTNLFAAGGGYPGGDGNNNTKASGKWYRCFANIGHSLSHLQNNAQWVGHAKYCLPNRPTHCNKEWNWSLDPKDDTVSETEASKNCQPKNCKANGGGNDFNAHVFVNGAGRQTPVETYYYCVYNSDWDKVAKCIDKSTGEVAPNSVCDKDATGSNYYYKPKCDATDTKESCNTKLDNIKNTLTLGWRFCYQPPEGGKSNVQSYYPNAGGQTVKFKEFINDKGTKSGPCEQYAIALGGGNSPDENPDTGGNLVILDEQDNDIKQTISNVHTKISGKDYKFRIFAVDSAGQFSSGISSLTCTITESDGTTTSGQAQENGLFNAIFGGKGKNFIFGTYSPTSSGEASISCVGTSKGGKPVSATTNFFIAPHSYSFNIINAEFDGQSENLMNNTNNDKLPLKLESSTNENALKVITHNNDKWNKKPVVKIGGSIQITLAEVQAMTFKNAIDTGVDSANNIGTITATPNLKVQGITDANKTPPNTINSTCANANPLNPSSVNMTKGVASADTLFTITENETLLGKVEITLLDTTLHEKIKQEKTASKCFDSGNFPCPFPQVLQLTFDYEVVPNDFKVELLDNNGNSLKVLYFGQGSTPEIEEGSKLKVTALKQDKTTASTFTNNCSSQNIALEIPTMSGKGFSLEIVDKNGAKPFVIPANKFKNGIAGVTDKIEAIIKVDKDNGVPFTPNMKSEPIITTKSFPQGIPATLSFAQFANSYYPKYDTTLDNEMVILRARINAIDTDNIATNFNNANPTKVYYEFQCEYCNLDEVGKITGVNNYEKSKTQQGWWIDKTFSTYNATQITKDKLEIENLGNAQVKAVSNITNGFQDIAYNFLASGTYKLNIRHGIIKDNTGKTILAMPNFLLYNSYWNSSVKWNTNSFIYIKGKANDEQRNYGVDTGGAKNTRSGGRIGRY